MQPQTNSTNKEKMMELPPVEVNKILYATDLSETAVHAFAWAVSLANTYHAEIAILHVMKEFPGEQYLASIVGSETWQEIKGQHYSNAREALIGKKREDVIIENVLKEFSKQAALDDKGPKPVSDSIIIEQGDPAQLIVQTAQKNNCDIIVMGTHGHSAVANALIGSTAKQVIRKSPIPVMVIRLLSPKG